MSLYKMNALSLSLALCSEKEYKYYQKKTNNEIKSFSPVGKYLKKKTASKTN